MISLLVLIRNGVTLILLQELIDPSQLDALTLDARKEGFLMLDRLQQEWRDDQNRFNQAGERLFVAVEKDRVVGVCGLNRDPYSDDDRAGRVRRLYVLPECRRRGVGRLLVTEIINNSSGYFDQLRLRTDSPEADAFYCSLGFHRVAGDPECTHLRVISPRSFGKVTGHPGNDLNAD
ncbi:MAG: GNAT family N-acetyltransferase [Planctomycetaceae bacterium]|nr:GNAT family N-acetyltransferase [Planctomycetaceae bacterium]MCA9019925.1 GNAT family N-acetyltransferase [Planctomycetaceae bacterium]